MDWLGGDRRKVERSQEELKFRCFMGGRRFNTVARGSSAQGAFVELDRVVRPGTVLILELLRPGYSQRAPALIGEIVHFSVKPVMGAGVMWRRAVSEDGLVALGRFLSEQFGLAISESEQQRFAGMKNDVLTVAYDFSTGCLSLEKARRTGGDKIVSMFGIKVSERTMDKLGLGDIRVVQSEAPSKKRAVLRTDPDESDWRKDTVEEAKRLEEWTRLKRLGRPVEVPVVLSFDGGNVNGRSASVSNKSLFVQAGHRLPAPGARVLVRFPVRTAQTLHSVIIVGEVQKTLRSLDGSEWGCSLEIVTVNEGENDGIFRRYVETL